MTSPLRGLQGAVGGFTRSIGALAAPLAAAFSFGKVISETKEAQAALAQLTVAYQNSAQAARRSKGDILDFSDAAQRASTFSDEAVTRSQTVLLRFSRINKETFDRARRDILDVAAAMGTDLNSAAFSVGRALEVPSQGLRELRSLGIIFTESQRNLIKSLEETGQRAKAQEIILGELEKRYSGAAEAARNTLGGALEGLKNAFGDLFESSDQGANEVADGVNKISEVISDPKFKANIQSLTGELLSFVGAFANVVATSIEGLKNLGQYAAAAYEAVTKIPTKLDALFQKQNNLGASLNAALEEQAGIARNQVNDPRRSRELAEQISKIRGEMAKVRDEINNVRQGAGGPQRVGSRQRSTPGTGPAFVSEEELSAQREDAQARADDAWKREVEAEAAIAKRRAELRDMLNSFGERQGSQSIEHLERTRQILDDIADRAGENIDKALEPIRKQQEALTTFIDTFKQGLTNLAMSGKTSGRDILKYLLSAFQSQVLKAAIDALGNYLKGALGGTGKAAGIGSFISGLFGAFGHAAGGGRGGIRWVGEEGPELDTGGGNIMNRRQLAFAMGGSGGTNVTFGGTTIVIQGSENPAQTAQYVEARIQANNRKQLEQMNRLLRENYGRGLR